MKPKQHHKFIAILMAATVAITAFGATSSRADEDFLKALAAIAGIAIVGKVIHDQVQTGRVSGPRQPSTRSALVPQHTTGPIYDRSPLLGVAPRQLPDRAKRSVRQLLPGGCLRSTATREGRVRYFGQRCLQRNYSFAHQLPQACAVRVRGQEGVRRGFEARCLRSKGYQLARN
ncbi:MAG: hypothetical protein AB8B58_18300 [Roseobacter sp.]